MDSLHALILVLIVAQLFGISVTRSANENIAINRAMSVIVADRLGDMIAALNQVGGGDEDPGT